MPKQIIFISKKGEKMLVSAQAKKPCNCHDKDHSHDHNHEECDDCKQKRLAREAAKKANTTSGNKAAKTATTAAKGKKPCGCGNKKNKV